MSADSYIARQREHEANYRRDYAAWVNSLPEEERRQLKAKGIDAPSIPGIASGLGDAATSTRARCQAQDYDLEEDSDAVEDEPLDPDAGHEPEAHPEPSDTAEPPHSGAPQAADTRLMHRLLRRLVGELAMQDHVRLSLECLALATGLSYDGFSMTAIALRHGVTRAAVSKRCVELTQALGLPPSRAMRRRKARHSYRNSRTLKLRVEA